MSIPTHLHTSDVCLNPLIAYFRSGWAFLLPYLGAYLLYAWLKWPVNADAGEGSIAKGTGSWIPCLLHVYWILHTIHIILAMVALRSWWRPASASRPLVSVLWSLSPWIGFGLLFWIPGVYMEFPADPWQHYARTNEWSWHELVTQHSQWKKSSYFLAYSFIGRISPALLQLKWFDAYYTVCCLLLCWQYYRLARAVGLSERTSLLFVLINLLTFGNNIFGFYRYYGMSPTVFAQLGAVALTRIAIEAVRGSREKGEGNMEAADLLAPSSVSLSSFSSLPSPLSVLRSPPSLLLHVMSAGALAALTAFNHVQGLGITAIGIAAVVAWRLVAWKRSMLLWLAATAIILSVATVLWYPRHPALDSSYRPNGWISPWYGFPLLQPGTRGFDRAWVIIGTFGGLNLLAGVWLLLRNRLEGWLTLMPVVLLSLPFVGLPFASILAVAGDSGGDYIIAFHRMLFAVPCGLAVCSVFLARKSSTSPNRRIVALMRRAKESKGYDIGFAGILLPIAALAAIPAGQGCFNRLHGAIMIPADDLAMKPLIEAFESLKLHSAPKFKLSSSHGQCYVARAIGIPDTWYALKQMTRPPSFTIQWALWEFRESTKQSKPAVLYVPSTTHYFTALSANALLSQHWNPRQANLEALQGPALDAWLIRDKIRSTPALNGGDWYWVTQAHAQPE